MKEQSEARRLRALRGTGLLDAPAEGAFDRLTRLAARTLGVPIALVSLVDESRQFFLSAHGLSEPWSSRRETPLSHSFCLTVTTTRAPLVVADAREDAALRDNLAVRDLAVVAYAGVPIILEGEAIGAVCAVDSKPRQWAASDVELLQDLAASVVAEMELRIAVRTMAEQRTLTMALFESLGDGILAMDPNRTYIVVNDIARRWFQGAEAGSVAPRDWTTTHRAFRLDGSALPAEAGPLVRALRGEATEGLTFVLQGPTAAARTYLEASGRPVRSASGEIIAAIGVFRDVTERRREADERAATEARVAVRAGEASLETILDSIADALIVTDESGLVRRMNPVAEKLTGAKRDSAYGQALGQVFRVSEIEGDEPLEHADRQLLASEDASGDFVLHAAGGAVRPISASASAIDGGSGTVLVFRDRTRERDAQAALAASEAKYRELYESSLDMFGTVVFPSEVLVDCNQTLCRSLGYTREEIIGRPYEHLYAPEYRDMKAAAVALLATDSEGFMDLERRLQRKDGTFIDVSLNARIVRDADGRVTSVKCVWRDVSRRTQAERDRTFLLEMDEVLATSSDVEPLLAEASSRLGRYLGASRCVFADVDLDGDSVRFHPHFSAAGAPLPERSSLSAFGPEVITLAREATTIVVRDTSSDPLTKDAYGTAFDPIAMRAFVAAPQKRDGKWSASLVVASESPRTWEEREVAMVRLVAERLGVWLQHRHLLDAVREREVARAVERSEERSSLLLDAIKDYAIFMLDDEGRVRTWTAGAERLKGYRADEILGHDYATFFEAADIARGHPRANLAVARRDGRCEEEGWRLRKDGSRFAAHTVLTTLYDADGKPEGFAKITRDVTQERLHAAELLAKQTELQKSLREREVLLQEVHHRVKNNLQVISSIINMQARKIERGAAREALVQCQTRVLAIALIHEKLYQSKDYSQVDFADYMRGIAAQVFRAGGRGLDNVSLELGVADVPLGIDRAIPCGLIVNELVSNALKHAFPDGRTGTIRVRLRRVGERRIELRVEDDGVGLPANFAIEQAQSMGLQLVMTLSEQLEGTLLVESGSRATFSLTFDGDS